MNLPVALYTAAQVRELDRLAIEDRKIPGAKLMQRAGEAVFDLLRTRWPRARRIVVLCGSGNNGGDGYVVARLAREAGLAVDVLSLGAADKMHGDAGAARKQCKSAGVSIQNFQDNLFAGHDVIVDALLGIGLERPVEGEWRAAIDSINNSRVPVLALDVPSGLHADTGRVMGVAVRANATMTFIGLKAGMFTGAGREHSGEIFFNDLGVPPDIYAKVSALMRRLTEDSLHGLIPRRRRDMHKGDAGHVLVIGGDRGMPGAARLAGEAAYRAGAGLVMLATHPEHAAHISAARPELIVHGVATPEELRPLLARADVIAVGPGLGQGGWGEALFGAALDTKLPMVVDADALNILAADPLMHTDWILTPHPGEASRMLGMSKEEIQADRFAAVHELVASFGGVCVLKGAGTLVASLYDGVVSVCDRGNPGMATGGMGDVLTGVIAGLRAQGLISPVAARLGVWAHASAGDDAAHSGEIGVLASDLLPHIRTRLNRLVRHADH
ncbi:MAG: NAD(P)H-hydrate dehydratase [Sulfuricaulis sp.]|uniref:NAD(P)H-hydrate dehydratase n=1 Tax=Sulfuricaulis sp. TaxID=2003553 RepID=UPI0025CDEA2D|nr:NAD(P)H-hydrate dehydratase [Sulfuricaulis sp.]MCR4346596.1 NAD(P)H-hydrate dehydratase [Sulfuricaulis sp.]